MRVLVPLRCAIASRVRSLVPRPDSARWIANALSPEACADVGFASHSERTSHTAEAWTGRCLDRMLEAIPGGSQPRHATLEENLQQPVNRGR
jgi:hypothetical protein